MDASLQRRLDAVPGHIGVYARDLTTGEAFGYHETELFQAASVIKLPILAAVFLRAHENPGVLEQEILVRHGEKLPGCGALQHIAGDRVYDVLTLCKLMITISDNTATNALIRHFGLEGLNGDFRRLGLRQTKLSRLLFDAEAAKRGLENLFQPLELCALLQTLYGKELVSPRASQQMTDILLAQQIGHKIPGRLPPELPVAHKTGEDDGITNDVGLVLGPRPMVLVFASNGTEVPAFEQVIRDLSHYFVKERE